MLVVLVPLAASLCWHSSAVFWCWQRPLCQLLAADGPGPSCSTAVRGVIRGGEEAALAWLSVHQEVRVVL